MIDDDAKIVEVRRIYLETTDGDCVDFAPRTCFFMLGTSDETGCGYADGPIHLDCTHVLLTDDAKERSDHVGWSTTSAANFWLADEDCIPVDDDTDVRIRAMSALLGELPVRVREF